MTSRQLRQSAIAHAGLFGALRFDASSEALKPEPRPYRRPPQQPISDFPHRPDANILSETIPLFYIGRNQNGFWVARESEGRSGGLFWRRQSALRFARNNSKPAACATMVLSEPLELDIENRGSRTLALLDAALGPAKRRAPALAGFFAAILGKWRKPFGRIARACADERRHRRAIETELFHGQYILSSKHDDDLPIA
jgi:hypothetical protein